MVDRLQGKKVVGVKQATKEIKNGRGHTLYLAKDADKKVIDPTNRALRKLMAS